MVRLSEAFATLDHTKSSRQNSSNSIQRISRTRLGSNCDNSLTKATLETM